MARCLRCKAGNEWIEGPVAMRVEDTTFTPHQVEFLALVMRDYLDVTKDAGVRRDARNIFAKLQKLRPDEKALDRALGISKER